MKAVLVILIGLLNVSVVFASGKCANSSAASMRASTNQTAPKSFVPIKRPGIESLVQRN